VFYMVEHKAANSGAWCRTDLEQAEVFAVHLAERFQPLNHDQLSQALQMDLLMQPITSSDMADVIAKQNPKKAPGHDLQLHYKGPTEMCDPLHYVVIQLW